MNRMSVVLTMIKRIRTYIHTFNVNAMKNLSQKFFQLFFSKTQWKIYNDCKTVNIEEFKQWIILNVIRPIIIILIPLFVIYLIPNIPANYKSVLFKGSLTLIGLNTLFGMSSYLVKYKSLTPKNGKKNNPSLIDLDINMLYLRDRLSLYCNTLVYIGACFYMIQVLFMDFSSPLAYYIFIGLVSLVLYASIYIARFMFIIRDEFLEKALNEVISNGVESMTKHWDNYK